MPDNPGPETGSAVSKAVFDGVAYDVIAGPDGASPLVQRVSAAMSRALEIDALARHLLRVDDLLHIAACGLAGRLHPATRQALGARVMGLQYRLRGDAAALELSVASYGEGAGKALGMLKAALKDLYGLYEADALTRLERCRTQAGKLADSAAALEGRLRGLIDETAEVIALATETCAASGPAAQRIAARRVELDAALAELLRLRAAARGDADPGAGLERALGVELVAALAEPRLDGQGVAVVASAHASAVRQQQRQMLQAMARDARQPATATQGDALGEAAVLALLDAHGELAQLAALLADQRGTLARMAMDCARLAETDLCAEIGRLMSGSAAQRAAAYGQRGFLARALGLTARWQGLQRAAEACQAALHGAYVRLGETYARNPTAEAAAQLAPQLGEALAQALDAEIRALGE